MAPLLLRPLLAGDCDLDNDFDVGGDGSIQLLQAAAAANHAQAIVITLLEEYDNIFGDHAETHEPYTDSEESGSETEEITDDEEDGDSFNEDDATEDSGSDVYEGSENESSSSGSKTDENSRSKKSSGSSGSTSPRIDDNTAETTQILSPSPPHTPLDQHDSPKAAENLPNPIDAKIESTEAEDKPSGETSAGQRPPEYSCGSVSSVRRSSVWGRTPAMKNLSMESIELPSDDETEIQKLEGIKADLQSRISIEAMENSRLLNILEKLKNDLPKRRVALEKEVARLQEQLENELDLKAVLEAVLRTSQIPFSVPPLVDEKTRKELEEISQAEADVVNLKKTANDLELQLNQHREQTSRMRHVMDSYFSKNPNCLSQSKDKNTDGGVSAISRTSEIFPSRNKHDFDLDKLESARDRKQGSLPSMNRPLPVNQQADPTQNPNTTGNVTSNMEMGTNRHGHSVSRKFSTKGEGANSTTSALSKLTNRLNFLKERRTQIASELQNLEKGYGSSQPVQNLEQYTTFEHRQFVDEPKGQHSLDKYGFSHCPNVDTSEGVQECRTRKV